ncbi:hypothetical protein WJX74_002755 [Apatococcus lobatus]|uniref:1,4-alpha-glucan branching enzyme n=1 Tax=Apatococcus lobatus TaxID=904363 RepID=A0AAW1RP25_9CHLO
MVGEASGFASKGQSTHQRGNRPAASHVLRGKGLRQGRRGCAAPASKAPASKTSAPKPPKPGNSVPLEVLRKENELLRETLNAADASVGDLEAQLQKGGVGLLDTNSVRDSTEQASSPEDYWSPFQITPNDKVYMDPPVKVAPPPEHDGTECLKWDDSLWTHAEHFKYRWNTYKNIRNAIDQNEGGIEKFSQGWKYYGFNRGELEGQKGIWYREWAPGARAVALIGEYNDWTPEDGHWAQRNEFGVWQLFLPDKADGTPALKHKSKVKTRLETAYGEWVERIPAWINWATQEWNEIQYNGVYYHPPGVGKPGEIDPEKAYTFKYPRPPKPRALRIYESHVGMSSEEPKVNSYLEFRKDLLPRVRSLGYNAIQIMAVQEHAYYGSFGYHVTNFFAASSRFGTPDELKALVDEAHRLGMVVIMDIVHSHASKNTNDGINMFDGTDAMYFHGGGRGYHWMWDSRCFNYGNWETLRFLLSNSRWWLEEYKFDGYRFDGVTSMMYHHHGLQMAFTGNYDEYFGMATDIEAVVYLMLMNQMLHDLFPTCITIGEDVSGMPTFARPVAEGGVGFDYRLQMAIADKWIEVLKTPDESWEMGNITHTLTNRRYAEPCVAYAESHDQALVGDKTIAFWLMDKDMYECMSIDGPAGNTGRGVALHKMIRLVTAVLGGEGYLNFMGNEFGHPEWIDFPRTDSYDTSTGQFVPGNGGSYDKCRRRWDLADAEFLKYKFMQAFDRAMQHLDKAYGFICAPHQWVSRKDEGDKLIVVERGDLIFVFNFHPSNSYNDYRVGAYLPGQYKIVLSSDEPVFGGFSNISKINNVAYTAEEGNHDNRPYSFCCYAPSRTVAVYAPADTVDAKADSNELGVPGLGVKGRGPYWQY